MITETKEREVSRRGFLRILGWGSFFATIGISIAASVRFLYPRVLFEQPSTFKIGPPDEFKTEGEAGKPDVHRVYETWKAEQSVWVVREKNRLYAILAKCTHLGCTPNWFADEGVFKCPCHGSQFNSNGANFAGPAPRPLDRCRIYIGNDGKIRVDKSRVYTFKEFDSNNAYLNLI